MSEGLTTPLDAGLGKGLGDTLTPIKIPETSNFGGVMDNLKPSEASLPKSTPKIDLNPKPGQTHVGAAQQVRNVKVLNQQSDLAAKSVQAPKKAPLTLNQKIEATTKNMNATRIAEQKAKMPTSQQAIYNDMVAKAKAGRQNMLAQQGTPQAAKLLGTASPTRSAQAPASQPRTATPAYKFSDEDDAAIGREADGIVKTKNLEGPLKYHKGAYATGTPKAKAEFENFLGKVHDKDPGKAKDIITNMRKSGFDVGGKSVLSGGNGQNMLHGGSGQDVLETQAQKTIQESNKNISGSIGQHGKNNPEDVAKVQNALVKYGVMDSKNATGYISPETLRDTKKFQELAGLKVDGVIKPDGPTLSELMKEDSIEQWREKRNMIGEPIQMAEGKRYMSSDPQNPSLLRQGLEWGWDFGFDVYDRATNPKKNTMTAKQALVAPAQIVGLGVLGGGGGMLPKQAGLAGGLLSIPAKIASDKIKKDYLNTQFKKPKKRSK